MAYTAVPTVNTGDPWSASDHNTYIKDNLAYLKTETDKLSVRYSTIIVLSPIMVCAVGDDQIQIPIPALMNGWNLTGVKGWVNTAGNTGTMTVQIENVTKSKDMLSTKLTFASGATVDNGSAAIDTTKDDVASGNIISINIDTIHTTPARGLFVELKWEKP